MRILFVYPTMSTFIKRDLEILKEDNEVIPMQASKNMLKTVFHLAWKIRNIDLIFIWFAGLHAFLPVLAAKIFGKKSLVVAGGYDTTCVPEINYGVFCSWWRGWLAGFVYRKVDKICVVDGSLKREILKYTNRKLEKKIVTIPTGYDFNKWKPGRIKKKMVLTVAEIKKLNIKRKGLDCFVKVAKYFPSVDFVLVGKHEDSLVVDYLKSIASENVKFTGFLPEKKLLKFYQQAKVYCQLSRFEGLPNALCEAMLCGCIPIGTKRCGVPTAIGDAGFYASYANISETVKAINKALNSSMGKKARKRIKNLFPRERRKKELREIIGSLYNSLNEGINNNSCA